MKRRALIALALVACGARWKLDGRSDARSVTIEPDGAVQGTVFIEASHPISTVRTIARDVSIPSGTIVVEQIDSREECTKRDTFEGRDGKWNAPESGTVTLDDGVVTLSSQCTATENRTTVKVRFVNQGTAPVTFAWFVVATTHGEGSEDPPGDAFIRVRAE